MKEQLVFVNNRLGFTEKELKASLDPMVCDVLLLRHFKVLVGWLVGFLTSSSTTRLYRGRAPRQSV